MSQKRILIIASYDGSLIRFRGDFIASLVKDGFEVFAAAPDFSKKYRKMVSDLGATPIEINLQRTGLNPIKDLKSILELNSIIKKNNIDIVFPYTVKPVIYGSFAANMSKTPVISLITGLGYAFTGLSKKARLLQRFNETLYKLSIRKNKVIVFQNRDDYQLFLDRKVISKKQKVDFVSGSGVNLDEFNFKEKNPTDKVSFLLVARLIEEKGIALYMEAAKILKAKYPKTEFHLIGSTETSPSAISENELNELHEKNIIVFHGKQSNIDEHLNKRDIFVLPSYYREGLPRTTLEACACGNPIITTDSVGCRESVKEGINGFLIEPQNLEALIEPMEFFINNPEKIKEMGINSRKYAEERFDVNIINNDLIDIINKEL
ncbi:MAG: glycosyltransferase family 1 protein [Flavobacteriaceae bacterium]|uniref:glycosyltransferase family 4 protein n=1 Tax=Winogradskyella sp. SYSU M77433 TaxID=3042722 RepID=UPI000C60D169|nr:glycosyltransferase family 4 protein [Winogradskyella sp. SYSU M77433]MAX72038.1 glycosyltransferase family 1 protein [Flavobacteriaceae bacterium]MDH7913961.1 glycosyltransferase family 4 protein [Winogradskyella sp. SYSU M77433]|tara:strand:- start:3446 stop:4576 length:1131 start_codon:yes stop_codon:yes gene_type:complete